MSRQAKAAWVALGVALVFCGEATSLVLMPWRTYRCRWCRSCPDFD